MQIVKVEISDEVISRYIEYLKTHDHPNECTVRIDCNNETYIIVELYPQHNKYVEIEFHKISDSEVQRYRISKEIGHEIIIYDNNRYEIDLSNIVNIE